MGNFNPFFLPFSQWTPWMLSRRFPVNRVNRNGIPNIRTIAVTTDTETMTVTYQLCPWQWRQLCNEGLLILRIAQAPAAGAEDFPVSLATSQTQTTATNGIPLIGSTGVQLTSAEVVNGNRLLIYFDKCNGTFQVINHIPAPAAAAATE